MLRSDPDKTRSPVLRADASRWRSVGLLGAAMTFAAAPAAAAEAEPFKVANIHFETNASACDMGIQMAFDTDGITKGSIRDPNRRRVYSFASSAGMKATGGQTEGFLEGVEPQITELLDALGCERSDEEEEIALEDLFRAWPEGDYTFRGQRKRARFRDLATLSYRVPAGPVITAPEDGAVVRHASPLLIRWERVTEPILPQLGPVTIVGYHVIVAETGAEASPQLDVDLPAIATSVLVPAQYLKPGMVYSFEVLSTEEGGNQTITESFFCTAGVAECEEP